MQLFTLFFLIRSYFLTSVPIWPSCTKTWSVQKQMSTSCFSLNCLSELGITSFVCVSVCWCFPIATWASIAVTSMREPKQVMPGEVRLAPPSRSAYYVWSGSRQSDRLPPEMTPVTERSAANLQASFCLNSPSPCCQILIFSVTASIPPLCFNLLLQPPPTPAFSDTQTTTSVTKITLNAHTHTNYQTHMHIFKFSYAHIHIMLLSGRISYSIWRFLGTHLEGWWWGYSYGLSLTMSKYHCREC